MPDFMTPTWEDVEAQRQRAEAAEERERALADVYDSLAADLRNEISRLRTALAIKEEECRKMGVLLGDKIKQFNVCAKKEPDPPRAVRLGDGPAPGVGSLTCGRCVGLIALGSCDDCQREQARHRFVDGKLVEIPEPKR